MAYTCKHDGREYCGECAGSGTAVVPVADDPTARVLAEVAEKIRRRRQIDTPDELTIGEVIRIAQRPFLGGERAAFLHVAALCVEQAARLPPTAAGGRRR